jgi:hypothetical protein
MSSEYVDLKIKKDVLLKALDTAIMHGGTIAFIRKVHASIKAAEQSMKDWQNAGIKYN